MQGLVRIVSRWARTRRTGQLTTWLLGLLIFFDDYANTMLIGFTMRPLCDRLKISREKLAFLVDSTAAPVAGVALVSTWIAVELDYIRDGLANLHDPGQFRSMDLFVSSIPYRFYVLLALFFVPMTALLRRDFGPMLAAERRAIRGEVDDRSGSDRELLENVGDSVDSAKARWYNAVVPIGVTVGLVLYLIFATGAASFAAGHPGETPNLRDVFGAASSGLALQYGALAGLIVAALLSWTQRILSADQIMTAAGHGAEIVLPALMILWLASTMSRMTGNKSSEGEAAPDYRFQNHRLYTGIWMQSALAGTTVSPSGATLAATTDAANDGADGADGTNTSVAAGGSQPKFSYQLLPTVVFLLASVVAFCTGTSYGTMGILVPMVIPLAHAMISASGTVVTTGHPIFLCSVSGVLAGAIFGDHCSPLSDTTILSSQSSGCHHIAHVRTQMPYAMAVGLVSVLLGTLPIGYGVSLWVLIPAQGVALLAILTVFGRNPEAAA